MTEEEMRNKVARRDHTSSASAGALNLSNAIPEKALKVERSLHVQRESWLDRIGPI
jgi:hypothetical protein